MAVVSARSLHLKLQLRGTILVALSGMLYGLIGYLGTQLFTHHFTVENMLFWRFFIAMLWMLFWPLLFKNNIFKSVGNYPSLFKAIMLGIISYSGGSAFYFIASKHIGTGLAMVIFFSYPVFVTLFAWLLSSWKMNKYVFISLMAVIAGLILLKGHGKDALDLIGIFFAMMASLFYATYVYGSQHSAKTIDSRLMTLLICLGNAAIFFVISSYTNSFFIPQTLDAWLYILAIGIIATAVPIQFMLDGLKYVSPVKASILSVLEPVVTVLIGLALLHETLSLVQIIGVMTVLLGALFIQFETDETKHDVESPLFTN